MQKFIPYKWEVIIWLWLVHFFNQADRQIFNVLLPLIKVDMQLSDIQLGFIASTFTLCVGLCIPLAGFIGDLYNRKSIIIISVVVWSAATIFTGTSTLLWHLIMFRCVGVGGGEAFYAPSANAFISENHVKSRALAISLHQTALYVGIILSGIIGGIIGEQYGWRYAFFIFGIIGILLGVTMFFRLRPSLNIPPASSYPERKAFIRQAFLLLFKTPSAMLLGGAFICLVYVNVGFLTWMPTYMHEELGQSVTNAGFSSMFYHHAFAFMGILSGGVFSDRMALKSKNARLIIQSFSLLLGAPFIYWMTGSSNVLITYGCLAGFGFFRGMYEANFVTTLFEVIEPKFHSSIIGIVYLFVFSIAAISPLVLGYFKESFGLTKGLSFMSIAYVIGSFSVFIALTNFINKDREKILQKTTFS
ncbi:MAG: MFS transporter [Janthinobacterium sp.]|jgi:MFS family permease